MENGQLKITIITVSYNAVKTIEETIQSVINQTYDNIKYIIIDGGSTDGTVDIIKKYEAKIAYWVSEPDNGIYDAMNKGIDVATGDYIYFLGADDWLVEKGIIDKVVRCIANNPNYVFYCGNVFLYDPQHSLIKARGHALSIKDIKYGNMYPHQGTFVGISVMKQKFNINYKIAADYEFLLRNVIKGRKIYYVNEYIAFYNAYGTSSDNYLYDEYENIILALCGNEYVNKIRNMKKYALGKDSLKGAIKKIVLFFIGEKLWMRLRGWKRFEKY